MSYGSLTLLRKPTLGIEGEHVTKMRQINHRESKFRGLDFQILILGNLRKLPDCSQRRSGGIVEELRILLDG